VIQAAEGFFPFVGNPDRSIGRNREKQRTSMARFFMGSLLQVMFSLPIRQSSQRQGDWKWYESMWLTDLLTKQKQQLAVTNKLPGHSMRVS